MSERTPRFSLQEVGTGTVRFPSGAPIPHISDTSVDPYALTRISKDHHVEGVMFWPQGKESFPALVLLHEWWGLNAQIKDVANRLASEGYVVLVPNLYGRHGGVVTAGKDVAEALMSRLKEKETMQDINACCEFLNTRDHAKRMIHGVVGFGMGGSLAIQFACHRRRLRAAVSYYGTPLSAATGLMDLHCPLLYHQAESDDMVPADAVERLREAATKFDKKVEIRSYPGTRHAFCNDQRKDAYHPEAAKAAWEAMQEFLANCFRGR